MKMLVAVANGDPNHDRNACTQVPWWSFTKTVMAAAALVLVARGRLDLDGPVPGRPFVLRHLLQHTAGIASYGGLAAYHEAVGRGEPP